MPVRRPLLVFPALAFVALLHAAEEPFDRNRAREIYRRSQQGEPLSADDRAYLEIARRKRTASEAQRGGLTPVQGSWIPLTELGTNLYKGEVGGLYGAGRNEPPASLLSAAREATRRIQPLDPAGAPSLDGKIVLLSLGMSNTTQEFSEFKRIANADPVRNPNLVIVDGAQGGQDALKTSDEHAAFWSQVDERLRSAGVTPQQVQVLWVKQAIAGPTAGFPAEAERLEQGIEKTIRIATRRFPNTRVAYLSSRIYAGYVTTRLNPEPYAYESAFAVRWAIQKQAADATAPSPVLLWGPYLWANGEKARADGVLWKRGDFAADGTHPGSAGRQKVAELLLKFFSGDELAKSWFVRGR